MQATDATHQVRGSGLLLAGRFLSIGLGFAAQVITVRYLAKGDFGALAFALSVVSLAASVAAFGLDKATSRFLPIYEERGERGKALGLVLMSVGTMAAIGLVVVLLVALGRGALEGTTDPATVGVLLLLVLLVPVQALDPLVTAILSALGQARSIFVRRHVLDPLLHLGVLAVVIVAGAGVAALAIGYVAAGLVGLAIYGAVVITALRRAGYLDRIVVRRISVPWREVLSFSVPLLSSDVVFVLRGALVVILLEVYGSALDVADFRSVYPQARLNLVVLQSFTFLYLPLAARLHERGDETGLTGLHRRTVLWIGLLSFPLFAASTVLAGPVVDLLYGAEYAASAPILAVLSAGFFVSALLGPAGLSLRARGAVRYVTIVDLATAGAALAVYFVIIPEHGAAGAAVATAGTLAVQAAANHLGAIRHGAAERGLGPTARFMGVIGVVTAALLACQWILAPPLWVGVGLVMVASAALLWLYRDRLDLAATFPEVLRVPVVGPLFAPRPDPPAQRAAR